MELKVRINKVDLGTIKAFADVTIGGAFVVKGLKVIEGQNGNFVSMPSQKLNKPYTDKSGNEIQYQDIFFPISKEARQELVDAVLAEFNNKGDDAPF